jgi:hypothetical protein
MGKKKPIVTPFGQWEYPGEVTIIPSNNITMQGVNYPVLGIDNLGNQELMMPGMDYTFPGDYVTEIPQMGKGGLTQWFAEEWTDIKTGKPCGRSGKDKDGRPYPACRPKKRVNETTPKTTSEMSSAEKAKFKREKTSGKRIDYNHKRKQQGGQWYTTQEWDDAMPDSTAENIVEFFDPTGYTSHDDARRAYQKWKKSGSTLPSFEQGMDMFGAVPALGKLGKLKYLADPDAMKAVYKYLPWQQIINAADTVQDEVEKKKYGGWLDNYQKGGETSTEQNPTRIAPVDIRVKRKKVSDSNRYMYDTEGNLVYNPSLTIYPEIAKGSTKGETTFQPNIPVNLLNPTLEELVNVAAPYYPIDNRLTSGDRINLPASNFQTSLEQDYILPQMVGRSFGNLPLNKGNTIDDGYGPNRRWTTNLNQNPGNYFLNSPETYAYILKGDKSSLVDYDQSVGYDKKQQVESGMSNINQRFDEALATQGYNIEMVDDYTANRPNQIWNRAEQVRVEMLNNPEIREWAKLHNLDLSNKYRYKYDRNNKNIKTTETDDNFASKIPESIYASRLAQAGLPTNRPDYYYGGRKTFIIQDPSKFNLAGYFPIDQEMIDSGRQMGEYVNDSSANLKNIMAKRMGIDPKNFDNGEYLIHYNRSPISEYTPGKKYGEWLNQYQVGGEKTPLENFERIEQVNIKSKQDPWYVRYPRMFGRAIDNKLTDFGHQYAQRISNATGGSEWYKQSNPFMNVALESMNAPQLAATYAVTGKVQTPSEAMDIQNPYGALATDILLDPFTVGAIGKGLVKGAPAAARYATTQTPLKNAYKYNPWAFKPNEANWYRQVGQSAIDDALDTRLIREAGEEVSPRMWEEFQGQLKRLQGDDAALDYSERYRQQMLASRRPNSPFFAKGKLFYPMDRKPTITKTGKVSKNPAGKGNADYLIETSLSNESFQPAYVKGMSLGVPTEIGETAILRPNPNLRTLDNFNLYKRDWLKGYKPIEVPKSNFKSEIDWGKWNPDTPKYPELINEYNAIEKATKQSGTWMKNPDGSPFQGTPEQFIQEQSSYFKKAYPEGYDLTYRGVDKYNNPDFSQPRNTSLPADRGIFTANRELAADYIFGNNKDILTPFSSRESPGLYELIHPKGKQIDFHTQTSDWTGIDLSRNTTKADLQQKFNETQDFVNKFGVGVDPTYLQPYYNRLSKIKKDIDEFDALNSDATALLEMRSKLGDHVNTDEIAAYLPETDLRKVKLRDIVDGNFGDVTIVNNRPGNYLKSRVGNVGFFDMTNPNIYKAVAPIGAGIGVGASQINKKKYGG